MATALVQAKIDPEVKSKAEDVFAHFGLDTSTAIRMFFAKVANTGEIPISLTREREQDILPH